MSCSVLKCGFGKAKNKKSSAPITGDKIFCNTHKKEVTVVGKLLDGGTLELSCGCHNRKWNLFDKRSKRSKKRSRRSNRIRKSHRRSRRFGFKYLRNDQIIDNVFHNYPNNLTCDRA
jgi:hypothetical protein